MTSDGGRDAGGPADGSVPTRVVVSRRPWAIPAIAVAALAIVLAGLLGQKPVPPVPPATPTPSPAPAGVAWTPIPLDPATFAGAIVGLVVGGPQGILVLGQDKADRHPISWTSPEGRTWTRHDQPAGTFGGGVPDAATAGGPGYIALGYHATADGLRRETWTSPDGATWTRTPSPTGRGFTSTTALVGSGGSAVLVADVEGQQRVLTSRDGSVWADAPELDATLGSASYVFGATPTAAGYLAVGTSGSDETTIWRSDDGRDWARASQPGPSGLASARVFGLYRTHMGFLAVGYARDPTTSGPAVWTSADGVSWTANPDDPGGLGIENGILALYALDGGDVAVMGDGVDGGGVGASLRVTVDLRSWFDVSLTFDGLIDWTRQAAVVDGRLLVLGTDSRTDAIGAWAGSLTRHDEAGASPSPTGPTASSPSGSSPTRTAAPPSPPIGPTATPPLEWHRLGSHDVLEDVATDLHLTGVVRFGSDLIGFGSAGSAGAFWRSTDAVHWRRLPAPSTMRGAWIASVAVFRNRLVAVGMLVAADGTTTPAAWTSTDAVAWKRSKAAGDWSGAELADVVAGPEGLVAVGRHDSDQGQQGAVWTSKDGSAWTPATSFPTNTSFSAIRAIARGDGGFVAVGQSQGSDPAGRSTSGAAWTSPDGRTWTAARDVTAFGTSSGSGFRPDSELTDVVAGGPGFVAVGSAEDPNGTVGAIFTSPDGSSWTRVPGDAMLAASSLVSATTWAGGLAVGGDLGRFGPSLPIVWTSPDGREWIAADDADFRARDVSPNESISALIGAGPGLVGVGTSSVFSGPSQASVWVAAPPGQTVADHVCPARIDSLARLAAMTGADRAACIGAQAVTIQALARSTVNDCGTSGVQDLSGCGPILDLAPVDGGSAQMTLPIDLPLAATFGNETFTPWAITLRTGVQGPTCQPAPPPNGVLYEPAASVVLQCQAVLRVVAEKQIVPWPALNRPWSPAGPP